MCLSCSSHINHRNERIVHCDKMGLIFNISENQRVICSDDFIDFSVSKDDSKSINIRRYYKEDDFLEQMKASFFEDSLDIVDSIEVMNNLKFFSETSNTSFIVIESKEYYFICFNFDDKNVKSDLITSSLLVNEEYLDSLALHRINAKELKDQEITLEFEDGNKEIRENIPSRIKFQFENENRMPIGFIDIFRPMISCGTLKRLSELEYEVLLDSNCEEATIMLIIEQDSKSETIKEFKIKKRE